MMLRAAAIVALCLTCFAAIAAEPAAEPVDVKMTVRAQRIVFDEAKQTFECTDKVTIIREDLTIDCDKVDGTFDPETRNFKQLIATGNVVITSQAGRAECHRAEFDPETQLIVMTGTAEKRPTVRQGGDSSFRATANKMIYDQKRSKFFWEGDAELEFEGQGEGPGLPF